ncbi:hypothetical protein L596_009890 [Steinernema carpocapsae]|uniref:Uncharacterized protein n=1 Tax=Steinernema carpocapsae TaxID=34508 RepID=A0A4U5PH69_STECR|nr:hypothetical protein L596_009890 [Steinernema carpocapsae]
MKVYIDGCFIGMTVVDFFLQIAVMTYPTYELYHIKPFFYILIALASLSLAYRLLFGCVSAVTGMVDSKIYVLFCVCRGLMCLCLFPIIAFIVCIIWRMQDLYIYGIAGMIVTAILDVLYFASLKTYHMRNLTETTCDSTVMYGRA